MLNKQVTVSQPKPANRRLLELLSSRGQWTHHVKPLVATDQKQQLQLLTGQFTCYHKYWNGICHFWPVRSGPVQFLWAHLSLSFTVHLTPTRPSWATTSVSSIFLILLFSMFRVAQKLSLSHRRKSQPGSASSTPKAPGPLVHSGGFSGALQLSPPALPPCLLRAGSKVKDKPRMGKVRLPRMPWFDALFIPSNANKC